MPPRTAKIGALGPRRTARATRATAKLQLDIPEEAKQRRLQAILNKLTPQNFEKLFEQVKAVNIDSAVTLAGVVSKIFDKAVMEPTFCDMYANFCYYLDRELPVFSEDNEKITFKRLLLNKCQEEFERAEREQEEADNDCEIKQAEEEREEKRIKAGRRNLGNIRLIGELYKKKMLTERIMHECIQKLLGQNKNPDEKDVEALCILMSTKGEMIDHPKAKEYMDAYFDRMAKLSNNMKLSSRVRFMLKDSIELRENKWQQRRKLEGPNKRPADGSTEDIILSYHTDRFAATPAFDQLSGQERNTNYSNRELRTLEQSFDRPIATSPPTQVQALAVAQNLPSEKMWPEELLHDMSMAAIKEFYSARDEKEVALCIKDMNSPGFHPSMISLWVTDSFERKDVERDLLAMLLVNLSKSRDGILSQGQLIKGFESVLATLEDAVIDAPKAAAYLGRIFAKVVEENVIPLREIGRLLHEGGEEPGHLLEFGLAGDVLGSTFEIIKADKKMAALRSLSSRVEDDLDLNGNVIKFYNQICKCGKRAALKVSETDENPNKLFYTCVDKHCKFFMWWKASAEQVNVFKHRVLRNNEDVGETSSLVQQSAEKKMVHQVKMLQESVQSSKNLLYIILGAIFICIALLLVVITLLVI